MSCLFLKGEGVLMSILLINASTKEKLEQALQAEETISENKNNFRFRRWWAKQRIAWMQALKTDLETQTDIRKLWNWWPSGFWLKVVVMFHRFFFQMKGDLNKDTLHDEGEELEKIQAELNAYGKSVHRGQHICAQGVLEKGSYRHDEWIEKLAWDKEEGWKKARERIIQSALSEGKNESEKEPETGWLGLRENEKDSLKKERRLLYFAKAKRELKILLHVLFQQEPIASSESVSGPEGGAETSSSGSHRLLSLESTGFWEEFLVVVDCQRKNDSSNGMSLLGHISDVIERIKKKLGHQWPVCSEGTSVNQDMMNRQTDYAFFEKEISQHREKISNYLETLQENDELLAKEAQAHLSTLTEITCEVRENFVQLKLSEINSYYETKERFSSSIQSWWQNKRIAVCKFLECLDIQTEATLTELPLASRKESASIFTTTSSGPPPLLEIWMKKYGVLLASFKDVRESKEGRSKEKILQKQFEEDQEALYQLVKGTGDFIDDQRRQNKEFTDDEIDILQLKLRNVLRMLQLRYHSDHHCEENKVSTNLMGELNSFSSSALNEFVALRAGKRRESDLSEKTKQFIQYLKTYREEKIQKLEELSIQRSEELKQALERQAQASKESAQASKESAQTSKESTQAYKESTQAYEESAQASGRAADASGRAADASEKLAQASKETAQASKELTQAYQEEAEVYEEEAEAYEKMTQELKQAQPNLQKVKVQQDSDELRAKVEAMQSTLDQLTQEMNKRKEREGRRSPSPRDNTHSSSSDNARGGYADARFYRTPPTENGASSSSSSSGSTREGASSQSYSSPYPDRKTAQ